MTIDPQAIEQASRDAQLIASLAKAIQAGSMRIDSVSDSRREAVRKYLAEMPACMTPQQFHARQNAQRMRYFRELGSQGFQVPRASQKDHDFIFGSILSTVDAGTKPAVKPLLREYAEQQGYAPEWAERVAAKYQPKRMAKSLKAQQRHPVIQDLKGGHMFTQTHQSALKSATYSGLAELLFSGSQSAREKKTMRDRMAALEARLAVAEAEAARANARLDIKDAGLDWKEKARAILAAEPDISKRELAVRVGKSHTTVNKYVAEMRA
jgi:hypothetical protein